MLLFLAGCCWVVSLVEDVVIMEAVALVVVLAEEVADFQVAEQVGVGK